MVPEVGAVVQVIQCAWCYIVWDNDLFSRFSWDKDTGVSSGHKQSVGSYLGISDQESNLIIISPDLVVGVFPDIR